MITITRLIAHDAAPAPAIILPHNPDRVPARHNVPMRPPATHSANHQAFTTPAHSVLAIQGDPAMTHFRKRPGTRSAMRTLKRPFHDIRVFSSVIRKLIIDNPLRCTAYHYRKRVFPPVMPLRERYTAKFAYLDPKGKQVGTSSEVYDSAEGYEIGSAAMITNMANIAAHRGKVAHLRDADLFSVTLKCHDPEYGFFFISLARDRITVASYADEAIRRRVEGWADSVPELR